MAVMMYSMLSVSRAVRLSNITVLKCCTGLSIELLLRISQALNFEAELYEVEDFQWGAQVQHVSVIMPRTSSHFEYKNNCFFLFMVV